MKELNTHQMTSLCNAQIEQTCKDIPEDQAAELRRIPDPETAIQEARACHKKMEEGRAYARTLSYTEKSRIVYSWEKYDEDDPYDIGLLEICRAR